MSYAEEAFQQLLDLKGWPPERLKERGVTFALQRFHAKYLTPARWRNVLGIESHLTQVDGSNVETYINVARDDSGGRIVNMYAAWSLVDLMSGEKRPLYKELRESLRDD